MPTRTSIGNTKRISNISNSKACNPKPFSLKSGGIRRFGDYFAQDIDTLCESELTDYFSNLIGKHSWSAVKLALDGLKFYTLHKLGKPRATLQLIKSHKAQRLPDIVTVDQAQRQLATMRTLSCWVYFFTPKASQSA